MKTLVINILFLLFSCTMLVNKANERSFHSKPGFPHVHLSLVNDGKENTLIYSLDGVEKKLVVQKISENEYLGEEVLIKITKGGDLILNIKDKQPIEFFELYESDKEDFGHKEEGGSHHGHTH